MDKKQNEYFSMSLKLQILNNLVSIRRLENIDEFFWTFSTI